MYLVGMKRVNNPLSVELYKQLGLHRKLHHLMLEKYSSAVVSNVHFIAELILRYLPQVYCTDSTKMGTKRVFSFQQKLSYLSLQDIRAVRLVSFSAKI